MFFSCILYQLVLYYRTNQCIRDTFCCLRVFLIFNKTNSPITFSLWLEWNVWFVSKAASWKTGENTSPHLSRFTSDRNMVWECKPPLNKLTAPFTAYWKRTALSISIIWILYLKEHLFKIFLKVILQHDLSPAISVLPSVCSSLSNFHSCYGRLHRHIVFIISA